MRRPLEPPSRAGMQKSDFGAGGREGENVSVVCDFVWMDGRRVHASEEGEDVARLVMAEEKQFGEGRRGAGNLKNGPARRMRRRKGEDGD